MRINNLRINKRITTFALAGIMLVTTTGFATQTHVKSIRECDLESTPIEKILESEEIRNNTTIDEEIENGNIDIINEDNEFRKHAKELTYDNYRNNFDYYVENMKWVKEHYPSTVEHIMFAAGKGAVADALETDMNRIKLYPSSDRESKRARVQDSSNYPFDKGFKNKSSYLDNLVIEICNVQGDYYSLENAKAIQKEYDNAINTANMVIATGINRHDDNLEPKYSKKYVKKNFLKKD